MTEQKKTKEPIFDIDDRGYNVKAWYMATEGPASVDALVEIRWQGRLIILKKWPAYKIYNIAAHFSDIVDTRLETVETMFLDESHVPAIARYCTKLERANNTFGAMTAEWPDLWQRISDLKANNENLVRQNKVLKSRLRCLWRWMKDAGCSFNIAAVSLTELFFKDHPELKQWFNNQKELK